MAACTLMVALVMAAPPEPPERVGQIFIVGNTITPQNVILDRLPFFPGQLFTQGDLRKAKDRLRVLSLLGVCRPSVYVLESDGPIKDILVTVEEGPLAWYLFAPRDRCDLSGVILP